MERSFLSTKTVLYPFLQHNGTRQLSGITNATCTNSTNYGLAPIKMSERRCYSNECIFGKMMNFWKDDEFLERVY